MKFIKMLLSLRNYKCEDGCECDEEYNEFYMDELIHNGYMLED
ncbi:MAG: hypothetical protein RR620_03185 [Clostridium sp.]